VVHLQIERRLVVDQDEQDVGSVSRRGDESTGREHRGEEETNKGAKIHESLAVEDWKRAYRNESGLRLGVPYRHVLKLRALPLGDKGDEPLGVLITLVTCLDHVTVDCRPVVIAADFDRDFMPCVGVDGSS